MGKGAAPIPAGDSCCIAPSPFKEPRVDLSTYGCLWPASKGSAHQNPLSYAGIRGSSSMGTYFRFPRCDYLLEKPIAWRGYQHAPYPGGNGNDGSLSDVTMSTSCVVWDEATGATYLDMVTTSVGRVALKCPWG